MSTTPEMQTVIQVLQQNIESLSNDNLELRGKLDEQQEQQRELSNDNSYLQKKLSAIQQENQTLSNTQARLETQLYAQEQDNTDLRKEIQQLAKARKDAEKKLTNELEDFENDRTRWQQREADLINQVRSLNSTHGEPRTPRTPRRRSITATTMNGTSMSPFTNYPLGDIDEYEGRENGAAAEGNNTVPAPSAPVTAPKLAAIDASYAREAKIAQRTIKAQDKLIADLKSEIEQQKSVIQEQRSEVQQQSLRLEHLDHEIANVKQVNRSLMEDNESYQILLHEKTISGEFMMNPIMQIEKDGSASPTNEHKGRSLKPSTSTSSNGLNLAAELNLASVGTPDWEASQKANETDQTVLKLTDENKVLQDTNRALQLYMNKILMKIINNKQLEDVLSIDQPKPQPTIVTSTQQQQPAAKNSRLAQRAGQKQQQQQQKPSSSSSSSLSSSNNAPAPSRTLSSSLLGKSATSRQQRRRTISYWGSNKPQIPAAATVEKASSEAELTVPANAANDKSSRRHSSIAGKEPERPQAAATTTSNSGWAKALRRMSGIGWSSKPAGGSDNEATMTPDEQDSLNTSHSSTSSSGSSTDKTSSESARKLPIAEGLIAAPSMSRSTSTNTSSSLRRSNELATLQEE
ncbi:hypothetical protein BDB00DRAFT_859209 [Zychaea mexicana]|uniref:uncharacterized protein n=1 Tax=Zychaea mexicana TaxID=64656 RepID=UPI0022FEFD66|nr:uncharacterized protein BDB00DRAFT_859209 [Zychaea mexicana]KAI9477707.1 hypothetical protein BDB00DRAFT_859209 [Zychaea mexicana]